MNQTADNEPGAANRAARPAPAPRSRYRRCVPLTTPWSDNDAHGHLTNVNYLSLFDGAVNAELVGAGVLDIAHGVARVGRTSVSFEIGNFATGAAVTAAHGRFVRVYVDRETRRPVPLPERLLAFAKALQ